MRDLTSVELWEHFGLDPTTAEWWNTDATPVTPAPTSGGVMRARIAAMEDVELYQTVPPRSAARFVVQPESRCASSSMIDCFLTRRLPIFSFTGTCNGKDSDSKFHATD